MLGSIFKHNAKRLTAKLISVFDVVYTIICVCNMEFRIYNLHLNYYKSIYVIIIENQVLK